MSHWIDLARQALRLIAVTAAFTGVPVLLAARPAAAQSYQRISAHCTRCNGAVSTSSRKGDTCPHCGVVWGGEEYNYLPSPAPAASPAREQRRASRPTPPLQQASTVTRKSCTGCGRTVSVDSRVGGSCPHCGAMWQFERTEVEPSGADDAAPAYALPAAPVDLGSSLYALKIRRPAVVGQLPTGVRWMDQRAERVIARLPALAQEAYYLALESFSTADATSRIRTAAAMRVLALLPERHWSALSEDVSLAFRGAAGEPGGVSRLRRDPAGTLQQVRELAEFLAALD